MKIRKVSKNNIQKLITERARKILLEEPPYDVMNSPAAENPMGDASAAAQPSSSQLTQPVDQTSGQTQQINQVGQGSINVPQTPSKPPSGLTQQVAQAGQGQINSPNQKLSDIPHLMIPTTVNQPVSGIGQFTAAEDQYQILDLPEVKNSISMMMNTAKMQMFYDAIMKQGGDYADNATDIILTKGDIQNDIAPKYFGPITRHNFQKFLYIAQTTKQKWTIEEFRNRLYSQVMKFNLDFRFKNLAKLMQQLASGQTTTPQTSKQQSNAPQTQYPLTGAAVPAGQATIGEPQKST